jgi:hypothetical protein
MKTDTKHIHITRKKRKLTFEEIMALIGRFLLVCIIAPFYYGWKGLQWLYIVFLCETYETGNNGILGPGFHSWTQTRFSWGKFAFFLVVIFIILMFIF